MVEASVVLSGLRGHQRSNHFNFMCVIMEHCQGRCIVKTRHSYSGYVGCKKPILNYYPILTKVSMLKMLLFFISR